MMTADIIIKVRKKLPYLLLATVATFCFVYLIFLRNCATYKSQSSFYINENVVLTMGMGHDEPQELTILSTIATNKVLLLISSDELRDSIINDFDLYKHYGINKDDQFAHEKVLQILNRKANVRRDIGSAGLLNLTVEDCDRYVAAGIANKIIERVNKMDKLILQRDLRKRAGEYEYVLPSLEAKASGSRREFLSFVDSLNPVIGSRDADMTVRYKMIASDLVDKMGKSTNKYDDMLDHYYNIMANVKTVGNDEWQCVTVVKKALPDITVWYRMAFLYSLSISLFALLLYVSMLIYFYQNDDQMKLLLIAIKGEVDNLQT